jgi:hypothetical protein
VRGQDGSPELVQLGTTARAEGFHARDLDRGNRCASRIVTGACADEVGQVGPPNGLRALEKLLLLFPE